MEESIVYTVDRFGSVLVDTSAQTPQLDISVAFTDALARWKSKEHKGVWITVHKAQSSLIPQLIEFGFDFHHAQRDYVCLNKWLLDSVESNFPDYANQYLGVAGFVVNDKQQLLVVREKYRAADNISSWKLPGGHANKEEDLSMAGVREVREETGIESEYVCVLAFRHMHNYRYGCSDFYYVCLMRPLNSDIKACPMEIAECKWMDLDEYESSPEVSALNKFFVQKYREVLASGNGINFEEVLSYDKKSLQKVYTSCDIKALDKSSLNGSPLSKQELATVSPTNH